MTASSTPRIRCRRHARALLDRANEKDHVATAQAARCGPTSMRNGTRYGLSATHRSECEKSST